MPNENEFKNYIEQNSGLIEYANYGQGSKGPYRNWRDKVSSEDPTVPITPTPSRRELSANTKNAYDAAIRHFQFECGLWLPASPDSINLYLRICSTHYAPDTLKLRLSALSRWHVRQGTVDPTEHYSVKALMYQISLISPHEPTRTESFTLDHLRCVDEYLRLTSSCLSPTEHRSEYFRITRDRAMFLLAFWRALGTGQLCKIYVRNLAFDEKQGLNLTCLDRHNVENTVHVGWRAELCAASAVRDWTQTGTFLDDALFQKVQRNGELTGYPLSQKSIVPILQQRADEAGAQVKIGAHSFRRGFGEWAYESGWNLQSILEYVGWNGLNRHLLHLCGRKT